jgi:hypothetical protein
LPVRWIGGFPQEIRPCLDIEGKNLQLKSGNTKKIEGNKLLLGVTGVAVFAGTHQPANPKGAFRQEEEGRLGHVLHR